MARNGLLIAIISTILLTLTCLSNHDNRKSFGADAVSVYGFSSGNLTSLTMEALWLGENITLTVGLLGSGDNWTADDNLLDACLFDAVGNRNTSSLQPDCPSPTSVCRLQTQVTNFSALVQPRPWRRIEHSTSIVISLRRVQSFGYRDGGLILDSLKFNFSNSSCFKGSPALPLDGVTISMDIKGFTSTSYVSGISEASTELDVRVQKNTITISALYNSFLSQSVFNVVRPAGITGRWLTLWPTTVAVYEIDRNTTFNISSVVNIEVVLSTNATLYGAKAVPTPDDFLFPIYPIIGPRTSCIAAPTPTSNNIYEGNLRSGNMSTEGSVIYVTFLDPTRDSFALSGPSGRNGWSTAEKDNFISLARLPPNIRLTVDAVNTTTLTLNFTAINPDAYELDVDQLATMRVPPNQLASLEVGCGTIGVNVKPSAGTVYGGVIPSRTEVEVMSQPTILHFYLQHDEFVPPGAVDSWVNESTEPGVTINVDAERAGYLVNLKAGVKVTLINATYATVLVPSSVAYNIPTGLTESISFSFAASALKSGRMPAMLLNNTLNITSVEVTAVAIFASTGTDSITSEELWNQGALLVMHIIGDKWADNKAIWNQNHPRVKGLVTAVEGVEGYSYENLVEERGAVFDYATVNLTDRIASLRMVPLTGLTEQFDERASVSQLQSLVRGRPPILSPDGKAVSIKIKAVAPANIRLSFSGITDNRMPSHSLTTPAIYETDIRNGFSLFLNLSYQVFPKSTLGLGHTLFTGTTALTEILTRCTSGRGGNTSRSYWEYNITCSPNLFVDFDILATERINILVPNTFYFGDIKPAATFSTFFDIVVTGSPQCWLPTSITMTERQVRAGAQELDFLVQTTDTFSPLAQFLPMNKTIVNKLAKFGSPLMVQWRSQPRLFLLGLAIIKNVTYDITQPDFVEIFLNRHFFDGGEKCTGRLNFTVEVEPGRGHVRYFNDSAALQNLGSDDIKTMPIVFSVFFTEEQLAPWMFTNGTLTTRNISLEITASSKSHNPNGADEMVKNRGWAARAWYNSTLADYNNFTGVNPTTIWHRFDAVLPPQPEYRITSPEVIFFNVPRHALASGLRPVLSKPYCTDGTYNGHPTLCAPNSITVKPARSGLTVTIADVNPDVSKRQFPPTVILENGPPFRLNESVLVRGDVQIQLKLEEDMWVDSFLRFQNLQQALTRQRVDGTPLSPFTDTGSLDTIFNISNFVLVTNSTLQITTSPDRSYNAMADEVFMLPFAIAGTVTGFAPRRANFSFIVVPEKPYVTASGPALFIGSTDFIEGGAHVDVILHNDNFILSAVLTAQLCRFNNASTKDACAVDVSQDNLRKVRLTLFRRIDEVVVRNQSFSIQIPSHAVTANETVNSVALTVWVQRGIGQIFLPNAPNRLTESMVRRGQLPPFVLSIYGDTFQESAALISAPLAASITCTPRSDEFGFCARAGHLFAGQQVTRVNARTVTVAMQADEDFDIAAPQTINITLSGKMVASGLVPLGYLVLTLVPETGSYTFTASHTSVTTAQIAKEPFFAVDFVFQLTSERFVADPTASLVQFAQSSLSIAAEPNGFARNKQSLFLKAAVSANGRTAGLTMIGNPTFALLRSETISFNVDRTAVLSLVTPVPDTAVRSLTILMSGGEVSMTTPSEIGADVIVNGFNITLLSTQNWDTFGVSRDFVSEDTMAAVLSSSSSPLVEPSGFTALRSKLVPTARSQDLRTLVVRFPSAPGYKLKANEIITLKISKHWMANGNAPFPAQFSVTVSHYTSAELNKGSLVFYIPSAVDLGKFAASLATFAGLDPALVKVVSHQVYKNGFGRFREVRVLFSDLDSRPAATAASFVRNSDEQLLKDTLNVTLVLRPEEQETLTEEELDIRLGLRAPPVVVTRDRSMWWVWAGIAFVLVLAAGGYFFYKRTEGRFLSLTATANRTFAAGDGGGKMNSDVLTAGDGEGTLARPLVSFAEDEELLAMADGDSTLLSSASSSAVASKMSQQDVDSLLALGGGSGAAAALAVRRKRLLEKKAQLASASERGLHRVLGEDSGPNLGDEFDMPRGQPVPTLCSGGRGLRPAHEHAKRVDVDDTIGSRQPAAVFGGARRGTDADGNGWAQNLIRREELQERSRGEALEDEEDGTAVFPPGTSVTMKPMQSWRERRLAAADRNMSPSHAAQHSLSRHGGIL